MSVLLILFHSSVSFSQPYIATKATIKPAMIAARIMYHNICIWIYCMYATNAATVIPMERTNTRASVGIVERTPTPLNTWVITDTQNARIPITAKIIVMFANRVSMLVLLCLFDAIDIIFLRALMLDTASACVFPAFGEKGNVSFSQILD